MRLPAPALARVFERMLASSASYKRGSPQRREPSQLRAPRLSCERDDPCDSAVDSTAVEESQTSDVPLIPRQD